MLYYLLAGIFVLAEAVYMGVKRRRAYYFFRLFGRVYGSLDFFHTKVLVAPGKLGFYYKGIVPKGIKKYSFFKPYIGEGQFVFPSRTPVMENSTHCAILTQ